MVKGNSRQVIVVHNPEQKLFEQAIFILRDDVVGEQGITEEMLLKSAEKILQSGKKKRKVRPDGPLWACGGAICVGLIWLLTVLI